MLASFNKRKGSLGFTVIEMLVSLSIFAVITGFATANFRAGRQADELRISANVVATNIRRVQTMGIAGQTVSICDAGPDDGKTCMSGSDSDCGGVGTCETRLPKGYGAHLQLGDPEDLKIRLYADVNGNRLYDDGELMSEETVSPGPFVRVSELNPDDSGQLNLVFEPPRPTVWINGSSSIGSMSLTLRHEISAKEKYVTVNAISGQVSTD